MFFRSCFCYFFTIYSKRYSKNIRDRSKKIEIREYNYLIIPIIKNVERASTARARDARDFHVRGKEWRLTDVASWLYVREWRRRGKLTVCLMVKLRFRLGRVTEKPLAHCTSRYKMDRIYMWTSVRRYDTIAVGPLENKNKNHRVSRLYK